MVSDNTELEVRIREKYQPNIVKMSTSGTHVISALSGPSTDHTMSYYQSPKFISSDFFIVAL
jgi:hypothetical protein